MRLEAEESASAAMPAIDAENEGGELGSLMVPVGETSVEDIVEVAEIPLGETISVSGVASASSTKSESSQSTCDGPCDGADVV
mmetsp:Transcript_14964/g.29115  ORF Transcript_14964/g.29115 Transcript_14964/m.29115 type:complete len:83 (-) Transcript_14964:829-1077(-)